MKKLFTLLLLAACTVLHAQTFTSGYYLLQVVRQSSVVTIADTELSQDLTYTFPSSYTLGDLPYIWKFEDAGNGEFYIQNCKTLAYIQHPQYNTDSTDDNNWGGGWGGNWGWSTVTETSTPLKTTTTASERMAVKPELSTDGKFWGFVTDLSNPVYSYDTGNYVYTGYLNDYSAKSICLWTAGPNEDTGSQFTVVSVDEDVVEELMGMTSPDKTDLITFMPESGKTYTLYTSYVGGYAAGDGAVSPTVTDGCEYAIEQAGTTTDALPTFYLRLVSDNKYLQHVTLSDWEDSSDTGDWTPYGNKATAATFTILKATSSSSDRRAYSEKYTEGDYVICDTRTYTYTASGETVYTYLGGYAGRMFFSPWTDSNHITIAEYDSKEVTPPAVEPGDDQSSDLFGTATDTIAVKRADGTTLLIPDNMIEEIGATSVTLKTGDTIEFTAVTDKPVIDDSYPAFRTFKFNNKYNDILIDDVDGEVTPDKVTLTVGACIGKTLCPSFSLTDEGAVVYYKGVRQISHQNRNRFDKILTYTVAEPGVRILQVVQTKEEVWQMPTVAGEETQVTLREDQLSTNAPSNYNEGLDCLIDGSLTNYYHSTWGSGAYDKLNYDSRNPSNTEWPYIDIKLDTPLQVIKWGFTTQASGSSRLPQGLSLLASNDGSNWTQVSTLTNLPTGFGETYMTDAIDMGQTYSHLRVLLTSAVYKNYLVMAEMYLYSVAVEDTGNEPILIQEAEYECSERPWGREVSVQADFLTDQASSVPVVRITLDNNVSYSNITKTAYLGATISIDGGGVFEDFPETAVKIRGRGNSSWSYSKKPYRLKFDTKQKPFGLKKGKSWCLIAQAQTGSMLTNPIAYRASSMIGTQGANHVVPVELYLNGTYRGSYIFTENPGFANNSIDIDETNAYMLELDTYTDDWQFSDYTYYNTNGEALKTVVKEPDLDDVKTASGTNAAYEIYETIQSQWSDHVSFVCDGKVGLYEAHTDIDSWSRFMLVNDVVRNTEMKHPKSVKLFRVDMTDDDSPYVWGPVWDFDWAFGYEESHGYFIQKAETDIFSSTSSMNQFFIDMQSKSEKMKADRYRVWTEFMTNWRDELIDYVDDYYEYVAPSLTHNATTWTDGKNYATYAENAKAWLRTRTNWVYNNMAVYDLPEVTFSAGDVNEDGRISVADVVCVINRLMGRPNDVFNEELADMNADGKISLGDMQLIIRAILDAETAAASVRARLPQAAASLSVAPFTAMQGQSVEVPVTMTLEEAAAAMQMDVRLPEGAVLTNVRAADGLAAFKTRLSDLGNGRFRVLILSQDGAEMTIGENSLVLDITMGEVPASKAQRRVRLTDILLSTPEGTDMTASPTSALFAEPTAIDAISADEMVIRGGEDLTIESVKDGAVDVYNVAGQHITTVKVTRGRTTVNLPMGVFIVAGQKIMID